MGVYRTKSAVNFTHLKNDILQDGSLSLEALGLLVYLLSMPEDWVVRNSQIQKHFKIGRDKRKRVMRELLDNGYLVRTMLRNENGSYSEQDFSVYDEPQTPSTENPSTGNLSTGNHTTTKDLFNKELKLQKNTLTSKRGSDEGANDEKGSSVTQEQQTEIDGKLLNAFDEYCSLAKELNLSVPRKLDATRKAKLKRRIVEDGLEAWREALLKIRASDFLQGNGSNWKVSFDFLLSPSNLNKVLEGNYDNKNQANQRGNQKFNPNRPAI